jgi:hypothetical protein
MKIGIGIFILSCHFFSCTVNAQVADTVLWQSDKSLHWMDYKGAPDYHSHYDALTHSEIKYKVSVHRALARFDFVTFFMKKSSWTKHSQDPVLLKHEQIHFNVAELHKRLFIQILYTRNLYRDGFESQVKRLGDSINTARNKMDDEFDADVSNTRDVMKINKWNREVNDALDRLKAYNRNSILIAIR